MQDYSMVQGESQNHLEKQDYLQFNRCVWFSTKFNFRAQPDWVEAAGEHPPVIDDKLPKPGSLPTINIPAKPFILHKGDQIAIAAGRETSNERLDSGGDNVKLKDTNKDDTK